MLKSLSALLIATTLSGCMGQMGASKMLTQANLSAIDNRYGRAGLYVLLSPVYGIAATADLFIFNSIEFWTGKNPITQRAPALVDEKMGAVIKVNPKLDRSLTHAPLANNQIQHADIMPVDDNTLDMHVTYTNGAQHTLRGKKVDKNVDFYLNDEFISRVSVAELQQYHQQQMQS